MERWREYVTEYEEDIKLETTKAQREYIKRMYTAVYGVSDLCVFPVGKVDRFGDERLYMHGQADEIHVHHIVSKRYAREFLGWGIEDINSPFNLVPICKHHHITDKFNRGVSQDVWGELIEVLHPDMALAFREYDGTPESFRRVFERRDELTKAGIPYWNDFYTKALLEKAEYTYYKYLEWQLEHYGKYIDVFPERRKRPAR